MKHIKQFFRAGVLLFFSLCVLPGRAGSPPPPARRAEPPAPVFTSVEVAGTPPFVEGLPSPQPPPLAPGAVDERPAAEDPGGNWGCVAQGFRLSLRLATNRFEVGQSVTAFVILRNCTSTNLHYTRYGAIHTGLCNFDLWDWQQKEADGPRKPPVLLAFTGRTLAPATQHRTWARLDKIFDLRTPGHYSVRAIAPVPLLLGAGFTTVVSGPVQFDIQGKGAEGP